MSVVLQVLLRAIVVGGASGLTGHLLNLMTQPGGGANIGAGLISFVVALVLSLVWGFLDGRRTRAIVRWVVIWAVVALIVAVAQAVEIQLGGSPGIDGDVLRSDLTLVAPFTFGLVLAPAALGIVLGSLLAPKPPPR